MNILTRSHFFEHLRGGHRFDLRPPAPCVTISDISFENNEVILSQKSTVLKRHMKRAIEIFFHQGPKAFFEKIKEKSAEAKVPESAPLADRDFQEAYSLDKASFEEEILKYDVISFDVFDTLLSRKYDNVDEVFAAVPEAARHLISTQKLSQDDFNETEPNSTFTPDDLSETESDQKKINITPSDIIFTSENFKKIRIEAEIEAIQERKASCNIDNIYEKLQKITNISDEVSDALKQAEIALEEDALIPRRELCDIFRNLVKSGETAIITSDMYLKKDFFEKVLSKNNLTGYARLYVSCEEGLRKDDGTLFEKVKNDYAGKSIIHIGDNRKSDFEMPISKGLAAKWIMNSETELKASGIEELLHLNDYLITIAKGKAGKAENNDQITASLVNGISRNGGLFNSSFALSPNGRCHFTDPYTFGYSAFGPLMYEFMLWLHKHTPEDANLLFLAREGYIFIKIYEIVAGDSAKPHQYLLASRRAVSVAAIRSEEDIKEIVRRKYDGSLHNLLVSRLGVSEILLNRVSDRQIHIAEVGSGEADDYEKTIKLIEPIMPDIIGEAAAERKNYLLYLDKNIPENERAKSVLVDVGYTGTIQYYMSKLLEKPVDAAYLAVLRKNEKLNETGSKVFSMYKKGDDDFSDAIEKTQLYLESVLQAPYGQLIRFDSEIQPIYRNEEMPSEEILALQDGMLSYCRDRKNAMGLAGIDELSEGILDSKSAGHGRNTEELPYLFSRTYMEKLYSELLINHDYMTSEVASIFKVEDSYSQDTSLHINPETHRWEI